MNQVGIDIAISPLSSRLSIILL